VKNVYRRCELLARIFSLTLPEHLVLVEATAMDTINNRESDVAGAAAAFDWMACISKYQKTSMGLTIIEEFALPRTKAFGYLGLATHAPSLDQTTWLLKAFSFLADMDY